MLSGEWTEFEAFGINYEDFQRQVYNNKGEVEKLARKASYEELEQNPKQLQYDARTADALEGREIERVDTRGNRTQIPKSDTVAEGSYGRDSGRNEAGQRGSSGVFEQSAPQANNLKVPPKDKPITLVLGGSFNPIHTGHINVALDAKRYMESQGYKVGKIILSPSPASLINKKLGSEAIALEDRAEMARILAEEHAPDANIEVVTGASLQAEEIKKRAEAGEQIKLKRTQLADWARNDYPNSTVVAITARKKHGRIYSGQLPKPSLLL